MAVPDPDILTLVGCPQCRVALYVGNGLGYSYCPRCNHHLTSDDMLRGTLQEIRAHASRHGWHAESTEIQRLLSPWEHT